MLNRHTDPIAAIATAPGRGAVGMVRVSGSSVQPIIEALCGRVLKAREATYLPFRAADGSAIDQGLALHFPAPHSYTGEDVLELQAHGGPVVLQLLLARCLEAGAATDPRTGAPRLPGLRLAQPGEFTERAFLNDKIDLAQAEAIADLIDASTEAAARSASRSLAGVFSRQVHHLLDALVHLRMLVEATLDFPEEEIDHLRKGDARGQLLKLQQTNAELLRKTRQGALLREGIKVVIAGQPNAGKSSLLNALAGAELAIVTPIAGTTRDKVQQTIQIEGVPLHIIDTAGLRESSDEVERIGIARTWDEIAGADAVLHLHDLAATYHADPSIATKTVAADALLARTIAEKVAKNIPVLQVWNKSDTVAAQRLPAQQMARDGAGQGLAPDPASPAHPAPPSAHHRIALSAKTGEGIEALRQTLLQIAGWQATPEGLFIARERHVQALKAVQGHLAIASAHLAAQAPSLDLLAEELRLAQNALGRITGAFSADDLLGEIFSRFCIGK
jgi:tRNA modification GTPase